VGNVEKRIHQMCKHFSFKTVKNTCKAQDNIKVDKSSSGWGTAEDL
jgi:hypothetical protein